MNKKILILATIILLAILVLAGFFYTNTINKQKPKVQQQTTNPTEEEVYTIDNKETEKETKLVNEITDVKNLQSTSASYTEIVNSKETDLNKYIGKKIKWKGKIASRYSQINGIKFCIVDDRHTNPDNYTDCDWFWAIPKGLATAEDPSYKDNWNGNWNEYVFTKYSNINYSKIDSDKDIFLVTGVLESIDLGIDYNKKPVPIIEVLKIEKE